MSGRPRNRQEVKFVRGREYRKDRPKTFKTEESANEYAKKNGIKKFELKNLKNEESSTKKLRILVQE